MIQWNCKRFEAVMARSGRGESLGREQTRRGQTRESGRAKHKQRGNGPNRDTSRALRGVIFDCVPVKIKCEEFRLQCQVFKLILVALRMVRKAIEESQRTVEGGSKDAGIYNIIVTPRYAPIL